MTIQLPQSINLTSQQMLGLWLFTHFAYGFITYYHWLMGSPKDDRQVNAFTALCRLAFYTAIGFEAKMVEFAGYGLLRGLLLRKPWKFQWHDTKYDSVGEWFNEWSDILWPLSAVVILGSIIGLCCLLNATVN